MFSRHFWINSSCTRLKTTTPNRTYSVSEAMDLQREKCEPLDSRRCQWKVYVEERGTTIAVNRSYFAFQSLTRFLTTKVIFCTIDDQVHLTLELRLVAFQDIQIPVSRLPSRQHLPVTVQIDFH